MKTLTFTYTKKDGSVSERTLLAMVVPNDKYYAGVDVSELDPVVANEFVKEADSLHKQYLADLQALQTKFDLKHNFRQFLASGVSDVTEI